MVGAVKQAGRVVHASRVEADVALVPSLRVEPAEAGLLRLRLQGNGDRVGCHHSRGTRRPPMHVSRAGWGICGGQGSGIHFCKKIRRLPK